ncbi:Integrase catalytic domain-containing protein [Citrus sinensis]|nr:Integrase catalytic domain-containing protein [Citrus sinensis]
MVEGETSRIGERSTETFSGDTSGGSMWRREVMDALIQIDLNVVLKNKRHLYNEEIWDRMNEKACGQIRSCLTKEVKYLVKDEECAVTLWRTLEEKYLVKSSKNRLHAMSQVYGFRMKPGVSMHDHVSRFEKLLADLKNLDEDIKDEVKAMILLHSLPEEYSHFVTTLIYGKSVIVFKDVCTALTSLEIRNNDKNFERAPSEAFVVMGNDQPCSTMGIGTIRLKMFDGMVRELKEVRFVPTLKKNLISVGALEAKGYKATIEDDTMKFTHGAMLILQGVRRHNLYYLKGGTTDEANVVEAHSDTTKLWHVRLGHAGEKSLQILMRHGLLKGTKTCKLNFCEHCVAGKKTRIKFGTANHDTHEILEYVHSDVWGPTKTASIGGSLYFVTFVDDFSRRVWVYTIKIKVLRSDNGGEYTSDPFLQVCQNEGIKRHFTVRHTPQQNGVAERMNRTLLEKVQCILSNAGLDKKFWAEAVSYASHLVNRLPSAAIGGKTPMEMWSGKYAQDYDSLRVFGCPAYYHVKDGKLDPRVRKAIFVGFKGVVKGFKFWDLKDKKFVCSRDVTFNETSMMKASSSQQMENKTKEVLQRVEFNATPYVPVNSTSKKSSTIEVTPRVEEEVVFSDVPQNEETIDEVDNDDFIATSRSRREIKKPGWLTKDMVVAYALPVIDDDIPNTFGSPNQSTSRYKARLVAKGFAQKEGIDYNEVFSPVVKHTSIRILLALVAEYELELAQLDIKTAFLHRDLEEEIYMIQPCGFRVAGKENHVCRSQEERDYMARVPHASAVGSLMYAMDCGQQCVGYCDSNFAGDLNKRRSTTGYVFTLGGGPVSWRLILQSTIALSTTEAEYMAATEAVKEAIWLKGLLGDLGVIHENIAVFCDNQSAIFLAKNQTYHARTKHIDVKYHYVREIIESSVVLLRKIDTKDNPLDMLTKADFLRVQGVAIPTVEGIANDLKHIGAQRDGRTVQVSWINLREGLAKFISIQVLLLVQYMVIMLQFSLCLGFA